MPNFLTIIQKIPMPNFLLVLHARLVFIYQNDNFILNNVEKG